MGIEVEMDGSGEIGDIVPGWSVQEYATPITIGDTAGGTGQVSFSAGAKPDSLFIVNNAITTTDSDLGSIEGIVKTVSQTGLNVSVTHNTPLAIFDANFDIPAMGAGGMVPVVDLASQLSERDKLLALTDGRFYSMRGHSAGFNANGSIVETEVRDGSYLFYNAGTGRTYPIYYREQYGSIWADSFTIFDGDIWATHVSGDCFSNNRAINSSRMAFKTKLSSGSVVWSFNALPNDLNTGSGQELTLTVDYASETLTLDGRYNAGGTVNDFQQQYNISSSLDIDAELAVFIQYTRPVTGNDYNVNVKICNTSDYAVYGEIDQDFTTDASNFFAPWSMTGNVRSIYRDQGSDLAEWFPEEYENPVTYTVSATIELNGPVAAQANTNLWEYVQAACSAFNHEVAAVAGTIVVREIDQTEISVDDSTPITITPTMTLSGRNVEVVYSNARNIVNGELYNAYSDSNRVITVKANETVKTTVNIDGTPTIINTLQRSVTPPAGVGEYCISWSNGSQVPQELWEFYGGKLIVELNPDVANAIDVTLIGPSEALETAGYTGPYKLAYTADGTDYAALSITGTGILYNEKTAKIRTSADPTKTAQDIAKTIKNPFINTKEMAYDRALNATIDASGPKVTITGTIPVSALQSFGMAAGSRIRYNDSIYRITDISIGNLGANFTASRHVTADDFDLFWNGRTVGSHDALWAGYDAADHQIKPLWFVGDNEAIVLLIDVDGNPYYEFLGTPEISVYYDTDGNPYYEFGYDEAAEPVYLDTDSRPYV